MPGTMTKGVIHPRESNLTGKTILTRSRSNSRDVNTAPDPLNAKSTSPYKHLQNLDTLCRTCKINIDDENCIQCDRCDGWLHLDCAGVGEEDWLYAKKNKKTIFKYFCPLCLKDLANGKCLNSAHAKTDARFDSLTEINKMIYDQSKDILKKLNEKESASPVIWPKVETKLQSSFTEVLKEQKEIEEKKCNIIAFNVPESKKTKEGKDDFIEDHKSVAAFLRHIHEDFNEEATDPRHCKVKRLGRRREGEDDKPRPIKIEFDSQEMKEKALRNARLLKDYIIPRIGLSHDKTKKEIEQDRVLKGQLTKKRESDPTTEYQIYNKEIMTKEEANAIKEEKQRIYRERQAAKASSADKPAVESADPVDRA